MKEIWKKIPYSNEYEVSNLGRFRHLYINRYDINSGKINKAKKITYPKLQKRSGYYYIRIYSNHKDFKSYNLHRIIAELFIPNPNNYKYVNHKNENKLDNRVENLEWCCFQYNIRYSIAKKVNQYDLKGNFIKTWECIKDASGNLNLNSSNIIACCKGERKKCGNYVWQYAE